MQKLWMFFLVLSTLLLSQEDVPSEVKSFIPANHEVLNFTKGDLNLDSVDDAILILKHKDENTHSDKEFPRPIYILIAQNGSYQVVATNNNAVMTAHEGGMMGDPFNGVTIKNGYFSLEYYGGSAWRWSQVVTFKYDKSKNEWFLHRDGSESFHASEPDKVETTIKTVKDFGVINFKDYKKNQE